MELIAKYTTAGMTKGKIYPVIKQGDKLVHNGLVKIVLDDSTVGLRAYKAFTPVV